jgi:hypothetical protein
MPLRDRPTRGGPLEPVIIADIDDGLRLPVTSQPEPGATFQNDPTSEFYLKIARGLVPGHSAINKFGENPDIDTGGFEDIWDGGGTYIPPTQSRIHDVVSTSALDAGTVVSSGTATGGSLLTLVDSGATFISDGVAPGDDILNDSNVELASIVSVPNETTLNLAGMREPDRGFVSTNPNAAGDAYRVVTNASTGASIFYVTGLDANFLLQKEFVVLNGLSNVPTAKSWLRQWRARVYGPNTTSGAVGIITSTAQVDGTVTCQINDGNNQTLMAIYTPPFDTNAYLTSWWGTLSKRTGAVSIIRLKAGTLDRIRYVIESRSLDNTGSSEFFHKFDIPQGITGALDVWVEADSNVNDTGVSAGFDIVTVSKSVGG